MANRKTAKKKRLREEKRLKELGLLSGDNSECHENIKRDSLRNFWV
jgi:hypothetical protein